FLRNRLFGDLYQDFLAFFQQVADGRHLPRRLVPWASAHAATTRATASATAVVWPAFRALLITCGRRRAMFGAGLFRILGFFFNVFAIFIVTGFFRQAKSLFHFFHFVRIQTLSFILAGGLLVHVSIAYGFHQLVAHGNHPLARLAQNFFFQLFVLGHVQVFFKPGHIDFVFLYLLFLH